MRSDKQLSLVVERLKERARDARKGLSNHRYAVQQRAAGRLKAYEYALRLLKGLR